jgi:hypothetical protein
LRKLVPDEMHIHELQGAVLRTHRATILVTQLLNLHVGRALAHGDDVASVFDRNWLMKAYQEVTVPNKKGKRRPTTRGWMRCALLFCERGERFFIPRGGDSRPIPYPVYDLSGCCNI